MCKNNKEHNWLEQHPIVPQIGRIVGFVCAVIILTGVVFITFKLANTPSSKIDNESLVISFIGVLATFIVIGNFAQTSRIEDKLKDDINNLDKRIITCESGYGALDDIVLELHDNSTSINTHEGRINVLERTMQESSHPLDKKDLARVLKLFVGRESDVQKYMHLYAKFLNPNSRYVIELKEGSKHQIELYYVAQDRKLLFMGSKENVFRSQDIRLISGVPFVEEDILYAYQLLNEIETSEESIQEDEKQMDNNSEVSEADYTTPKKK